MSKPVGNLYHVNMSDHVGNLDHVGMSEPVGNLYHVGMSEPVGNLYHVGVELVLDEAGLVLGLGHGDEVEGLVEELLAQQLILLNLLELFLAGGTPYVNKLCSILSQTFPCRRDTLR